MLTRKTFPTSTPPMMATLIVFHLYDYTLLTSIDSTTYINVSNIVVSILSVFIELTLNSLLLLLINSLLAHYLGTYSLLRYRKKNYSIYDFNCSLVEYTYLYYASKIYIFRLIKWKECTHTIHAYAEQRDLTNQKDGIMHDWRTLASMLSMSLSNRSHSHDSCHKCVLTFCVRVQLFNRWFLV